MKRKFVLRLLATVMAATLVVTGVPGTALTGIGIESVYAAVEKSSAGSNYITVKGLEKSSWYAIVKKSVVDAATDYSQTVTSTLSWVQTGADETVLTFNKLDADTEYVVYTTGTTDPTDVTNAAKTLQGNSATQALASVSTEKYSLADATVVLKKTSYTYSKKTITPEVESITLGGTTYTGDQIAKYFTIGNLKTPTVEAGSSFDITLTTDGTAKYEGTKTVTGVTITALDLSDAAAEAFITNQGQTTKQSIASAGVGSKAPIDVIAEGQTTALTANDYYAVYDNISTVGGTATITVTGTGNYKGTLTATYTVTKASQAKPSAVTVTPTMTSLDAAVTATEAELKANSYEFSISTSENPSSRTWVDADSKGKYSFTSCEGAALKSGTKYYIVGRVKATGTTEASDFDADATGHTLAVGDLSNAVITLTTAGDAAVTDTTYTYSKDKVAPTVTVKLDNAPLTEWKQSSSENGVYTVTYNYVEGKNADGTDKLSEEVAADAIQDAGTVRVTIAAKEGKGYCGSKTIDFVINKYPIEASFTIASATRAFDNTNTFTTAETQTITVTNASTVDSATGSTFDTSLTGKLVLTLAGSDVGTQKVTDIDYSNIDDLKNYKVTFKNTSTSAIKITQNSNVTFTGADSNITVYYGKPNTLGVTNTAGLAMTYSVVSGFEDYVSVDDKGVVTVKKIVAGVTPQIEIAVEKKSTDNYDSSKTNPVKATLTLAEAVSSFEYTKQTGLEVRPDVTEAEIIKAIGAVLKYQTNETAQGAAESEKTYKKITLDSTNCTVLYNANGSSVKTTKKPTDDGQYDVTLTYTGSDAAYMSTVSTTGVTITISKSATALEDTVASTKTASPVISGDTTFEGAGVVTITAAAGATIYYTTDGSVPTTNSTKYTGSFAVTKTTTVKAIAKIEGLEASDAKTVTFTKKVTADDPEEQLKAAQDELEQANAALEEAQAAAKKAESDKASAVAEAEKAATAAAEKAAAEKIAAAEAAQKAAEEKQAAAEAAQKKAEAAQKAAEDKAAAATTAATKVGDTVKVDGNTYKVTNLKSKTVSFAKVKKNAKTVNIVSSVEINGVTYKVTSIAASAFKGDKKLTSVTIPATVKTIGKNAFNGCTKLKTITALGSKITKIGKNAFKDVKKSATFTAPTKKAVKACKKLLKKAKFTGSVKKA